MESIDIINVAGLLMDGKDDGIEKELRETVKPRFLKTIAPTPISSVMEHPDHAVKRAIFMIREIMKDIERQFGEPRVLLIGRSYGAFIALTSAVRMNFCKIFKAILIEGPLHPDITVTPPNLLPPLMACGIHYRTRPALAQEAINRLKILGTSHLVVVQGGKEDGVVPTEAHVIPGDFETVDFQDDHLPDIFAKNGGRGLIVRLPPHIGGSRNGIKKILPDNYRNHLFWSDEKMGAIGNIVESAADVLDKSIQQGRGRNSSFPAAAVNRSMTVVRHF